MIELEPIGFLHCEQKDRYEAPRQGVFSLGNQGIIQLNPHCNFEQAVKDLDGFERIWLIYQFHINQNWKPQVRPPRYFKSKIGVFATRSPFRPNPIGLSCVKLEKVEGLKIYISEFDLLDKTPIFDIKPYLPYSDSFPDVKTGWVEDKSNQIYSIKISESLTKELELIFINHNINLKNYINVQLQFEPENDFRKRINKTDNIYNNLNSFTLSYRVWRVEYIVDNFNKTVEILKIYSEVSNKNDIGI